MPIKKVPHCSPQAAKHYKSISYETMLASWLLQDGWDVFMPMIDHGLKTDVLISDGDYYYRIQVKSLESSDESTLVQDQWHGANIDYVVYFSRCASWGFIAKPFKGKRAVNHREHIRFHQEPTNFAKSFKRA